MFPLHTSTRLLLLIAVIVAAAAVFTAVRGRPSAWRFVLLLFAAAAWPWPVVAIVGPDAYTIGAAIYAGTWTAGALLAGLAWGLLARPLAGFVPVALVALAPSLASSAFLLERQRIPDAPCAEAAEFHVGDLRLTVPRRYGLRSVEVDGAPEPDWHGYYGVEPGGKPQARALCRASDGGTRPIEVTHVWLSFSTFRRALEAECATGAVMASRRPVCDALARTKPTIVQFYAMPDAPSLPSLGQFNPELIARARAEGERDGYRCNDSTLGPQLRHCTVWQQVTPSVFAVSSIRVGPAQTDEDPLADTIILLDALRNALSRG